MASPSSLLARLQRVRAQNSAGQMVDGLGASQVGWLRQFGNLGRTGAVIEQDRIEMLRARVALRQLNTEVASVEKRINTLRRQATSIGTGTGSGGAGPASGRQTLAQRLKAKGYGLNSRGTLELGLFEIGAGGFSLNRGGMRALGGKVFTAALVSRAATGAINTVADTAASVKALREKGAGAGELARAGAGAALGGIRQGVSDIMGLDDFVATVGRIFGINPEDAKRQQQKFYRDLFSTREEEARRKEANKKALQAADNQVDALMREQLANIQNYRPQTFRLRNRTELAQYRADMERVNRELRVAQADALKSRARREVEAKIAEGG